MNQELNLQQLGGDPLAEQLREILRENQSLRRQLDDFRARARAAGVLDRIERPRPRSLPRD